MIPTFPDTLSLLTPVKLQEINQFFHCSVQKAGVFNIFFFSDLELTSLLYFIYLMYFIYFTFFPHLLTLHPLQHGVCSGFPLQNPAHLFQMTHFSFSHLELCRREMNQVQSVIFYLFTTIFTPYTRHTGASGVWGAWGVFQFSLVIMNIKHG